jgi:hypothetical protein
LRTDRDQSEDEEENRDAHAVSEAVAGIADPGHNEIQLKVISPVQFRKNPGARFAFAKEIAVELPGVELLGEMVETPEMIFGSLGRVLRRAFGFDEKSPIA